jgi:hypothetical protein
VHDADPLPPRTPAPPALRLPGPPHREVHLGGAGGGEAAEQQRGIDRGAIVERLARSRDRLAADQVGVCGPRGRSDPREGLVEQAVKLVQIAGRRGVGDLRCDSHLVAPTRSAASRTARPISSTISSI